MVVVFEALKLLNILSIIVYVLLLNLSLVFKNPITFFVIIVVSDGELETKENKIQTKGNKQAISTKRSCNIVFTTMKVI